QQSLIKRSRIGRRRGREHGRRPHARGVSRAHRSRRHPPRARRLTSPDNLGHTSPAVGGGGITMSTAQPTLTPGEQTLNDVWNEHLRAEFAAHSPEETIATMVANPRINHVPLMIGGEGQRQVAEFYAKRFLPQIPPDLQITPVSRTI